MCSDPLTDKWVFEVIVNKGDKAVLPPGSVARPQAGLSQSGS